MLEIYCIKITERLTHKFSQFKKFEKDFNEKKVYEKLISTYLKDENIKFNERVMTYKR